MLQECFNQLQLPSPDEGLVYMDMGKLKGYLIYIFTCMKMKSIATYNKITILYYLKTFFVVILIQTRPSSGLGSCD